MKKILLLLLLAASVYSFSQAPTAASSKNSIEIEAAYGSIVKDSFYVKNTGTDDLIWRIESKVPNAVSKTFTKLNNADWTLKVNQDSVAPDIFITRASSQALFNIAQETVYAAISPKGTTWCGTSTLGSKNYTTWTTAVNSNPTSFIGKTTSMFAMSTGKYYDVFLVSYSGGGSGGGFSYIRTEKPPMRADSLKGTIVPNDSQKVVLTFPNTNLSNGEHLYEILLISNDPINDTLIIPVKLIVKSPEATVNTLSDSIALYKSEMYSDTLIISNSGDASLIWNVSETSRIKSSSLKDTTMIGKSDTVIISIHPSALAAGIYKDTIKLSTNDPLHNLILFPIKLVVADLYVAKKISNLTLTQGFDSVLITIDTVFVSTIAANISYKVESKDTTIAKVSINEKTLVIDEISNGNTSFIITASDGERFSVSDTFLISVEKKNSLEQISIHLNVYPNPTTKNICISFFESVDATIELIDLEGKILSLIKMNDANEACINVSTYAPGLYILKINAADQTFIRKFIKE